MKNKFSFILLGLVSLLGITGCGVSYAPSDGKDGSSNNDYNYYPGTSETYNAFGKEVFGVKVTHSAKNKRFTITLKNHKYFSFEFLDLGFPRIFKNDYEGFTYTDSENENIKLNGYREYEFSNVVDSREIYISYSDYIFNLIYIEGNQMTIVINGLVFSDPYNLWNTKD